MTSGLVSVMTTEFAQLSVSIIVLFSVLVLVCYACLLFTLKISSFLEWRLFCTPCGNVIGSGLYEVTP